MTTLTDMFDLEEMSARVTGFLPGLLSAILILLFFWLFFRATSRSLAGLLRRADIHETLIRLLVGSIYRFVLIVFAVVMAADQLGVNVGAALAGLGVAGLAVGLAAQDSIANMIAGFLIFWDKPFEVGDWVTVADQYGQVKNITLRTTRIRTNRNTYVVLPNRTIIDSVLVNHSKHGDTRVDVPIGIAYKESIPEAREVILAAVRELEGVLSDPGPDVVVETCGSSSVDLQIRVWIREARHEQPVFFRVMEATKLALDEAGIQIPFPHLQLFVDDVQERVWSRVARLPLRSDGEDHAAGA